MRNLKKDLELCNHATSGPWTPTYGNEFVAQDKYDEDDCRQGICRLLHKPKRKEDSEFIAAAREGWPEAIKRAIKAEEENAELRDKMQKINDIAVNYQEDGPFIDTVTFAIISEIYDLSLGKE